MSERSVTGYLPTQTERQQAVEISQQASTLVLITREGQDAPEEERFDVPRRHAEALLDACAARIGFERTRLDAAGRMVQLTKILSSQPVDVVDVEFAEGEDAARFWPPAWFGPEVTDDAAWTDRAIAMEGQPNKPAPQANDAALNAILDDLEGIGPLQRFGGGREPMERRPAQPERAQAAERTQPERGHAAERAQSAERAQAQQAAERPAEPPPRERGPGRDPRAGNVVAAPFVSRAAEA
ncbi:CYTH domain-containing protein [Alsobacter sp. SYSU BS001988]